MPQYNKKKFVSERFATPLQQYLQTHLEIGPQEL